MEMHVLNMKANYDLGDLGKQSSYYITKSRGVSHGIDGFKNAHKNNQFSKNILFHFVVLTT